MSHARMVLAALRGNLNNKYQHIRKQWIMMLTSPPCVFQKRVLDAAGKTMFCRLTKRGLHRKEAYSPLEWSSHIQEGCLPFPRGGVL